MNKLIFKSEFEFINGTSPLQEGHVIVCDSYQKVLDSVKQQLLKMYELKPIIVIYNHDQLDSILETIKSENFRYYKGIDNETLAELKDSNDGILLMESNECRGIDVRFSRDAQVLIIAKVENYSQYLQMIGRSSRTRQACDAIMYTSTKEKVNTIMQKLKANDINPMLELERLVPFLQQRCDDKGLVKALLKQIESGVMIKSLMQLEKMVGPKEYQRLMKLQKK